MVACAPESESFVRIETIPAPLSAEQRYELADRRAAGQSWESIGVALKQRGAELRIRAEADPQFAKALRRARRELQHDGTADALKRLRRVVNAEDDKLAVAAAEVLTKHDAECRKDDTRRAADKLRAEVEMAKIRAKSAASTPQEEEEEGLRPVFAPDPRTPAEYAASREASAHETALRPEPTYHVYLWGGKHSIGRCAPPDDSDVRVGIYKDESVGRGPHGTLWVVPRDVYEASDRGGKPIEPRVPVS